MNSKILTIGLFLCGMIAIAQPRITLLTFESYSFSDKITTNDGYNGQIGQGFQYGGGLEIEFREDVAVELIYQRLSTTGYINVPLLLTYTQTTGEMNLNYYLIGGTKYLPLGEGETVSAFGSIDAGLGAFYSTADLTGSKSNVEKFCWGGRLGLRIAPSEKVSIRLHAQVLSAVQAFGGGLYFGTGGGGAGVTGYSTFWQWNLGGSVNFRLK